MSIIFPSVYGQDETVARALDMGAVDYLVKPFSPTELAARIRAALRKRLESFQDEPSSPYALRYRNRESLMLRQTALATSKMVPSTVHSGPPNLIKPRTFQIRFAPAL